MDKKEVELQRKQAALEAKMRKKAADKMRKAGVPSEMVGEAATDKYNDFSDDVYNQKGERVMYEKEAYGKAVQSKEDSDELMMLKKALYDRAGKKGK